MSKLETIEICCGSYEDSLTAFRGGAQRIELNSALYLGGLTPSLGTLLLTKKNTDLKIICMIRPRGAGFCYSPEDFEVMKLDAEIMMKNGADGLAFGCLTENKCIEENQTKTIIEICHKYNGKAVFHRAFDCTKDPYKATEKLIELGADRILTSGQKPKAMEGIPLIADLQKKYGNKIEFLAGSGINAENATEIIKKTGICQIHSSCREWIKDPTTSNEHISFAYADKSHENYYEIVSLKKVKNMKKTTEN